MQIKESFRDLKNTSNGLNLRHCCSYEKGRLNVALLIPLIANFILWLAGLTTLNNADKYPNFVVGVGRING